MLKRLSIDNYALIDHLDLELDRGLNIITGETGAGKSILLGALGLLLGSKSDGVARQPDANCVVEGTFSISGYGLEEFFSENDLDYAETVTIRRIVTPAGKSRAYIDDLPVQTATLKELGSKLIDIHSQHQNLLLADDRFRLKVLDAIGGNAPLLEQYAAKFEAFTRARTALDALRQQAAEAARDEEYLRFQSRELTEAKLKEGEQEELEALIALLANASGIKEAITLALECLSTDETGALARLHTAEHELRRQETVYPQAAELAGRIRGSLLEIKDISDELYGKSETIDTDPAALERAETRLATLISLQKKHHVESVAELIALCNDYTGKLDRIIGFEDEIAAAEKELSRTEQEAQKLASELTARRKKAAAELQKSVEHTLTELGMPHARLIAELHAEPQLRATGADKAELLFSANKNTPPQPAEKIASGGEISRLMLSIKSLVARHTKLPAIIFDEIDTGVSGRIADSVGGIIQTLAQSMQVVAITHLPQVASKGEAHFQVRKDETGAAARTGIVRLNSEERVTEIAKMLSGNLVTDAAVAQAKILLG